jgi:hypothetical protein
VGRSEEKSARPVDPAVFASDVAAVGARKKRWKIFAGGAIALSLAGIGWAASNPARPEASLDLLIPAPPTEEAHPGEPRQAPVSSSPIPKLNPAPVPLAPAVEPKAAPAHPPAVSAAERVKGDGAPRIASETQPTRTPSAPAPPTPKLAKDSKPAEPALKQATEWSTAVGSGTLDIDGHRLYVSLEHVVRAGTGTLDLNCVPWCRIYIDGKDANLESPAKAIVLDAGMHRLRVVNPPTGMARELTFDIKAGATAREVVRF